MPAAGLSEGSDLAMKKTVWILVLVFAAALPASLEAQWARAYGGRNSDDAVSIQPVPEGGFVMVGTSGYVDRWGGWVPQIWVVRLSASGKILWQRRLHAESGYEASYGACVQTTRDNRFVLIGRVYARSISGMGNLSAVKFDANGDPDWQTYVTEPGYPDERRWSGGHSVQQAWDGGYLMTGFHVYEQRDPLLAKASLSEHDLLIYKTDSQGKGKCGGRFGGSGEETGRSIQETPDGGFIVAGETDSFGAGEEDVWVLKFRKNYTLEWSSTYGGADEDQAREILRTTDGGYVVVGYTKSFGAGSYDIWLLKLNRKGSIRWQKTYGGAKADYGHSISATADGGFVVAGTTASFGSGTSDGWILRLNGRGAVLWEKTYGGSAYDGLFSVRTLKQGGCVAAGKTRSFGAGDNDALVLKIGKTGNIDSSCGLFVGSSKADVREGAGRADWKAGEGGCGYLPWSGKPLLPWIFTSAAATVICKK